MAFLRMQKQTSAAQENLKKNDLIWALSTICALHRIPFDAEVLMHQFPPPYTTDTLIIAAKALGLRILRISRPSCKISGKTLPSLALIEENKHKLNANNSESEFTLDLITYVSAGQISYLSSCTNEKKNIRCDEYSQRYSGSLFLIAQASKDFNNSET